MGRFLALGIGLLLSEFGFANADPLLAFTTRTGRRVEFYFNANPVDVSVKSVKVCTTGSPLKSLVLWLRDHSYGSDSTKVGMHDATYCTQVTDLNFVEPGDWELTATLENGEKAMLVIHVRGGDEL